MIDLSKKQYQNRLSKQLRWDTRFTVTLTHEGRIGASGPVAATIFRAERGCRVPALLVPEAPNACRHPIIPVVQQRFPIRLKDFR
jgi:hypothetical protein